MSCVTWHLLMLGQGLTGVCLCVSVHVTKGRGFCMSLRGVVSLSLSLQFFLFFFLQHNREYRILQKIFCCTPNFGSQQSTYLNVIKNARGGVTGDFSVFVSCPCPFSPFRLFNKQMLMLPLEQFQRTITQSRPSRVLLSLLKDRKKRLLQMLVRMTLILVKQMSKYS